LRIAHLTATFPPYPGGAGNTCYRFARGQAKRGHHVEVFTAPAEGEPPDPGGAVVHRIEPALAIGNAPLIPRLARIEGFDVVHIHYPFIFGAELTLLGRLVRTRQRQALLVHYKNRLVGNGARRALFEAYEHSVAPLLVRAADRVCVLSADHAGSVPYLRRVAERRPEKLVEMPNGVDTKLFAPGRSGLRARLGIPDEAPVVAFVATLDRAHHFKRLDLALEAMARVGEAREPAAGENRPRAHLVVAGGGELLEGFRRQAVSAGIGERVHFLGAIPHPELPEVLRGADLLLLTTEPPESFGIVLIEAMACGLPTIVTDYPGVRAVVDEGETGLVVPPGAGNGVPAAIEELIEAGAEARARMGAAGRRKCERLWSWPHLLDRMDDAYAEAIATRREKLR
jgi:glycosyltransferase involved in cell wall biosynthesis